MRDATVGDAGDAGDASDAGLDGAQDGSRDAGDASVDASLDAEIPRGSRGMWMWQWTHVGDATLEAALFDFALSHDVGTLYVESEALVAIPDRLDAFLAAANARGLEVELLFGNPEWARTENHGELLDLIRAANGFSVRGVHLDVEPYLLADWEPDPSVLGGQLLDLIAAVDAELVDDLELSVDVPFWFDEILVRGRPLSESITDVADRLVVLAYRDDARAIEAVAAQELAYASSAGGSVVVAVETTCVEPETITFCEEGADALERALAEFDTAEPSFAGFAVHSYVAWRDL